MNRNFIKYWLPLLVYLILIFYLSSLPLNNPNESREKKQILGIPKDMINHLIEYGFLAILSHRAFASSKLKIFNNKAVLIAVIFTVFYGLLDEIHQLFIPTRLFEIKDILSDSIGASIIVFKNLINKKIKTFRHQ